ncbi:MAG TPA: hypothetical protein VIN05_14075 [Roseovarius sp.]
MNDIFHTLPLEELCARTLEKIGHVTEAVTSAEVAGTACNQHAIRRSMSNLSKDRLLRHDICEALDRVISILDDELDRETQEIVPRFYGRNDPEEGAIGTIVHERTLTQRGNQIGQSLEDLRVLRNMLKILEHRLAAEQLINRRFGG